ncbi:hypothetical protein N7466_005544 [Penicillium verhagenii]|uniref:uncharacterized protein n=1 Tax=Penicillium verhagenii TaxID=1562060 RepID=UPI00254551E0|nr:uncharacterized protein N7466_005544 [Penicillium verhagenii]KAJ5930051.1 hypothetical protein N7466_005544 [Penicillium verhagenii]
MNLAPPLNLPLGGAFAQPPNSEDSPSNATVSSRLTNAQWEEFTNPTLWDPELLQSVIAIDHIIDLKVGGASRRIPRVEEKAIIDPNGLGILKLLSLEVLYEIIDHMDFTTISKFSQTCHYAHTAVKHHPSHRVLAEHCPSLCKTVDRLGLGYWNSLRNFRAELHFPNCRSCGSSGAYIFLPTCERICINCCENNKDYWCIMIDEALDAFALETVDLFHIPIVQLSTMVYRMRAFPNAVKQSGYYCPVKCGVEAGIKRWGSRQMMQIQGDHLSPDKHPDVSSAELRDGELFRLYRSVEPPPDILTWPVQKPRPPYKNHNPLFSNIALPFPYAKYLTAEPERHFLCRGCLWLGERTTRPDPAMLSYMCLPLGLNDTEVSVELRQRARTARTWPQMTIHAIDCLGCGVLMWDYVTEDFQSD